MKYHHADAGSTTYQAPRVSSTVFSLPRSIIWRLAGTQIANTDYVLSAYIWHLGDAANGGRAEIDLGDVPGEPHDGVFGSISIGQDEVGANDGYFVYGDFNTANTGTAFTVRAFMVANGLPDTGWPNQPAGALWDNIAITPADQFVAPGAIPEPSTLVLATLGLLGLVCGARRRRTARDFPHLRLALESGSMTISESHAIRIWGRPAATITASNVTSPAAVRRKSPVRFTR